MKVSHLFRQQWPEQLTVPLQQINHLIVAKIWKLL